MPYNIVTFHKCGSNWFRNIYWQIAERTGRDYIPSREWKGKLTTPVTRNGDAILVFPGGRISEIKSRHGQDALSDKRFLLCVRDPKDALVSQYFSWRNSHKNNSDEILEYRKRFQDMTPVQGMKTLVYEKKFLFAEQCARWLRHLDDASAIRITRYESLLEDFETTVQNDAAWLNLDLGGIDLAELKAATSFENIAGRSAGEENVNSHLRKGVIGDHINYFDPELSSIFEEYCGSIRDKFGYA